MKRYSALVITCILLPLLATAQEAVPRHEVFSATLAMQDPIALMPEAFKSIEKDMRAYRVAREQYRIETDNALNFSLDIGSRKPSTKSELTTIAQEFDARIRIVTQLYAKKNDHVKRMQATPLGKRLWQAIIEVRPEYNDALVSSFDARYHQAVLALLAQSRDAYKALAGQSTPYIAGNGQLFFITPTQSYIYLRHLAVLRNTIRDMVTIRRDKDVFILKQPGILNVYGNEYIAQLETGIKEYDAQLANWARTSALPANPAYSPLSFFLRVDGAVASDDRVIASKGFFTKLRTDLAWNSAFQKGDFVSSASIRAASEKIPQLLTPLLEQERATNELSIRLAKEISEQYNINRAIYSASDAEFSQFAAPATLLAYTHALLEYQKQVYALVQSCFPAKGKAKCTVKVVDDITLSVSDKKMQKSLDALKATFLATFKPEYDRYNGKQLP